MPLATLRQVLDEAARGGYGVGAFNVNNMEQLQGIVTAAQEVQAPVIVQATLAMGFALLTMASLSFIGLGIQPPQSEWGVMTAEGASQIVTGEWWLFLFPGLAIMITVLAFNLVGDGLRDFLDPRMRGIR